MSFAAGPGVWRALVGGGEGTIPNAESMVLLRRAKLHSKDGYSKLPTTGSGVGANEDEMLVRKWFKEGTSWNSGLNELTMFGCSRWL